GGPTPGGPRAAIPWPPAADLNLEYGVAVDGGGGTDSLIVNNGTLTNACTVTATELRFTGIQNLVVGYSRIESVNVNGDANDTVTVQSTGSATPVDVVGAGRVIVGHAGLASNINGRVSVRSPGGTALTIDNPLDTASRRVILTSTGLYGVAVADINWVQNDLRALTIRGGNGANTYTVLNTPQSDAPGGV